jgi:integrase
MSNKISKVKLREKPIKNGQLTLYLDFYPAIPIPNTGRTTRREFLGIYVYAKPQNEFERNYNKEMRLKAEVIRGRRQEAIINREYGFIDRHADEVDFLKYFEDVCTNSESRAHASLAKHFKSFVNGSCPVRNVSREFCQNFCTYISDSQNLRNTKSKTKLSPSTAALYQSYFFSVIHKAYIDKVLPEDYCAGMKSGRRESKIKEYLTLDEVKLLASSECPHPVMKRAAIFSCLTGLRLSDIRKLRWEDIEEAPDGGYCMNIVTQKTKEAATLPLCNDAYEILGERSTGLVFKGFTDNHANLALKKWIKSVGITKDISFHSMRHSFATLQLAAGTDLYVISKLLTHRDISSTQIYAKVVDSSKREAVNRLSVLK